MSNELALVAAAALAGAWLALFFLGWTLGGTIHLMPAVAIVLIARLARATASHRRKGTER